MMPKWGDLHFTTICITFYCVGRRFPPDCDIISSRKDLMDLVGLRFSNVGHVVEPMNFVFASQAVVVEDRPS